jgi:glycosyltransferase involved in cell wall biosynthesis
VNVLIISAQFPYPPRSGFATRVYQLARQLGADHQVTLLSYALPHERAGVDALSRELAVHVVERRPIGMRAKRTAQATSIASRRPFSCRAVHTHDMQRAITKLCATNSVDVIQLESSLLCAFDFPADVPIILDEHNIEYEVFQRMCEGERAVARRVFNRVEHARFRRFEQRWWGRVDGCVVTSEREVPIVTAHASGTPVVAVPNGVDLDYFRPTPGSPTRCTLAFNGTLTYRPNLDAAYHLVDEIWPLIRDRYPEAQLALVGRAPAAESRRLTRPGVVVAGEVPDVRPYLRDATVIAVPVRIGGGTRLKVVEGLAMGKPMVSTSLGCEGVAVRDGEHLLIADGAGAFASRVIDVFENPALAGGLGHAGRRLMERDYSWDMAGRRLHALYAELTTGDRTARDEGGRSERHPLAAGERT